MTRAAAVLMALWLAGGASAESALRFEAPPVLGATRAIVLDAAGKRIGAAHFESALGEGGRLQLRASTRLDSGVGSDSEAMLAPAGAGGLLMLVSEHSRTFSAGGALAIETHIDHAAARVRCAGAESDGGELALGAGERVANAPVQLLLRPLATGAREEVEVDIAVCRGRPRLLPVRAQPKGFSAWPDRGRVVEIELGPTGWLGALAGLVVKPASFWFDASEPAAWVAHRVALEPGGPDVIVVREGVKLPRGLVTAE